MKPRTITYQPAALDRAADSINGVSIQGSFCSVECGRATDPICAICDSRVFVDLGKRLPGAFLVADLTQICYIALQNKKLPEITTLYGSDADSIGEGNEDDYWCGVDQYLCQRPANVKMILVCSTVLLSEVDSFSTNRLTSTAEKEFDPNFVSKTLFQSATFGSVVRLH